jgi:sensor histidine kinase YesM
MQAVRIGDMKIYRAAMSVVLAFLIPAITVLIFGFSLNFLLGTTAERHSEIVFTVAVFSALASGLSLLNARILLGKLRDSIVVLLTVSLVVGLHASALVYLVIRQPIVILLDRTETLSFLFLSTLFVLSFSLNMVGNALFSRRLDIARAKAHEESLAKKELENRFLLSQIHPHFLYNALNTAVSLLPRPKEAEELMLDLAEFLRTSLDISESAFVQVQDEILLTETFLRIQKKRFSDRLDFTISQNISKAWNIPPLILQPLVENSIKHAMDSSLHIDCSISDEQSSLIIQIQDSEGNLKPEHLGKGTGLKNVKSRVELAGGQFEIENGGIRIEFTKPAD